MVRCQPVRYWLKRADGEFHASKVVIVYQQPTLFNAGHEARRQLAVDSLSRTTADRERSLQALVEQATLIAEAPIGAISIIDRSQQLIAARVGVDTTETLRSESICTNTILRPGEPLVIFDTTQDERSASLPMITGAPYVRFYVGIPLVNLAGYALGALCVVDLEPRTIAPSLLELGRIARQAERILIS